MSIGYRYWRLINIERLSETSAISLNELRFVTLSGVLSNNPALGISDTTYNNNLDSWAVVGNAFDNQSSVVFAESGSGLSWWIGYVFTEPQTVISVRTKIRIDMGDNYLQEWQTADVECSVDGVEWLPKGKIYPKTPIKFFDWRDSEIIDPIVINSAISLGDSLTSFRGGGSSILTGVVSETRSAFDIKPVVCEVLLYNRINKNLVQKTISDQYGNFLFKNLPDFYEFFVVANHPKKDFNSVISDVFFSKRF